MSWHGDNERDRALGDAYEEKAANYLRNEGYSVERHPFGKTGPDLWVYKPNVPGFLAEVRCKYPDKRGRYGLEHPKHLLWTAADIRYIIYDSRFECWFIARMRDLPDPEDGRVGSTRGGEFDPSIPNAYWPAGHWTRLSWGWKS